MQELIFHKQAFQIPLYRGYLVVVISNDIAKTKELFPKEIFDNNTVYAHCVYGNYKGQQGFYIVINPFSKYRSIFHGTIAHEALHACSFLLRQRGIEIDASNDEPQAYLIEWITDKVYEVLKKFNYTNKIK